MDKGSADTASRLDSITREAEDTPNSADQRYVLRVYALLAFLSLFVFGGLHVLVEKNYLVGYAELAGSGAVVLVFLLLRVGKDVAAARACLLSIVTTMLAIMLISGGTRGTGIFWFFIFPVAAFFLAGKRQGLRWMIFLLLSIVSLWIAARTTTMPFYYSDIQIRQLLVTLAVVGVGIYAYQSSRETSEEHARAGRRAERHAQNLSAKVNQTKSEFVTLASHQLRTPISAIAWSAEMLLGGDMGRLEPAQKESIQGIYDSNQRLGAIVDAMLLVSGLEMGELRVQPEEADLKAWSHKFLRQEMSRHQDKNLAMKEEYDAAVPTLLLDPTLTRHILQNLFSNAVKYTPAGGKITVAITLSDQKLTPQSRGSVLISVADTGYGIPKDDQEGVFAKLFRAKNIKSRDTDGTGLGLYIVRALLDQIGGRISFVSEENQGSTFTVQLPLEGMRAR